MSNLDVFFKEWDAIYFGLLALASIYSIAFPQQGLLSYPVASLFSLVALSTAAAGAFILVFFFVGLGPSLGDIVSSFFFSGFMLVFFLYFLNITFVLYSGIDSDTKELLASPFGMLLFLASLGLMAKSPTVELSIFRFLRMEKAGGFLEKMSSFMASLCNKLASSSLQGIVSAIVIATVLMLLGSGRDNLAHRAFAAFFFGLIFGPLVFERLKKAVSLKPDLVPFVRVSSTVFMMGASLVLSFLISDLLYGFAQEATQMQKISLATAAASCLLSFLHIAKIPKWYFQSEAAASLRETG